MNIVHPRYSRRMLEDRISSPLKDKLIQEQIKPVRYYCEFQIRSLRILDQYNNPLSIIDINEIGLHIIRFINDEYEYRTVVNINKRNSFLASFRCINATCCLFKTKRLMGEGMTKTVYEGIQVKINNKRDINSIKISSVALSYIPKGKDKDLQNEFYKNCVWNQSMREDNKAKLFTSRHIVKKSLYHYRTETFLVFVNKIFTSSFGKMLSKDVILPAEQLLLVASDVAEALAEIHSKGKLHRDIKAENISLIAGPSIFNKPLLKKPSQAHLETPTFYLRRAVLFDLEFMKDVDVFDHLRLTPLFAAPELADNQNKKINKDKDYFKNETTFATDLWAFGLFLFELFTHEVPYFLNNLKVTQHLCSTLLLISQDPTFSDQLFDQWKADEQYEKEIQEVIKKLLSIDPAKRGTAQELSKQLRFIYEAYSPIDLKKHNLLEALMLDACKVSERRLAILRNDFSVSVKNNFLAYSVCQIASREKTSLMKSAPTSWSTEEESSDSI